MVGTGGEITDSQSAYVTGKTTATDSQSAYINGATGASDSQDAYIEGTGDAIDSQQAYVAGGLNVTDSQSAYIAGQVADTKSAFIAGAGVSVGQIVSSKHFVHVSESSLSRVFLTECGARGDRAPEYESHVIAGGIEREFGEIVSIEYPDPARYGRFITVSEIRGVIERPVISLKGLYTADLVTRLLRQEHKHKESDAHVHFGMCADPGEFDNFLKSIVIEGAEVVDYSISELGALESGDVETIEYEATLSAQNFYEILPISFRDITPTSASGEITDVVMLSSVVCDDCDEESDGCSTIYSVRKGASNPSLIYSVNGGFYWSESIITGMGTDVPSAIVILGGYLVVFNGTTAGHRYVSRLNIDSWSSNITTGYSVGGAPNDAWSVGNTAFVVGDAGYVYKCTDPINGVSVVDAGSATSQNLLSVHAIDYRVALAGGESGALIYTLNGDVWQASQSTPTGADIQAVWMVSKSNWWVGTSGGRLYYTTDYGSTWTEKVFYQSGTGTIEDIFFATRNVMYVARATSANTGSMLRSYNGGNSLLVLPDSTGAMPASRRINAVVSCESDVNFCLGAGLSNDGASGHVVATPTFVVPVPETVSPPTYIERVLSIESANMVAYWPFNETAGITAVNAEGTVARDGTYTGVTLDSIAGPDGRPAGLWDGSNDYVNIYSSSLNSGWNPDEGTLSAWAKVLDNDTWSDAQVRQIVSLAVDENNTCLVKWIGST
jgi:hypothetical protein